MWKVSANERKIQILSLINKKGEMNSREVAWEIGISQTNASRLLSRYHKHRMLNRYTQAINNEKVYRLSKKGKERLNYLQQIHGQRRLDEHEEAEQFIEEPEPDEHEEAEQFIEDEEDPHKEVEEWLEH